MKKIVFGIVGPTASGKSKVAIELAKKFPIEIISCDSMQVYKGMDVGTAKSSQELIEKIPHHMIDIVEPEEEFSAAEYSRQAREVTMGILKRKRIPFLVGGSGLYFNSYVDGIFPEVGKDKSFRKDMKVFAENNENNKLHQKLKDIDPEAAGKIHPNDLRRVIRALEIYHITGKTKTQMKSQRESLTDLGFGLYFYGLKLPREVLYDFINSRVDELIVKGLVNETKKLKLKDLSLTAKMAIGYNEIYSYLDGNETLEEAIGNIKQYTRNYARRQMTWFKKRRDLEWVELESVSEWKKAVEKISSKLEAEGSKEMKKGDG